MLAQHLGWPFIELDRVVEEDYGASIPDLIEMAGTATFRRHEASALDRVIAAHDAAVITTAGGIVANQETYALLLRRSHTIWIKARPEDHMSRVMAQGDFRPMAQNREADSKGAMADLVAILEARRADYARAEAEVDTSGDAVEQSFAKLLRVGHAVDWARKRNRSRDARRHRLSRSCAAAARIPHDRAAAGRGADHRHAARRPRQRRPVGLVSRPNRRGDRRRRLRLFARRLRQIEPGTIAALDRLHARGGRARCCRACSTAIGFQRGILLGHSDGASIATIYAGSVQDHRVRGLVLIAPHFFTEEMGLAEIRRARDAFAAGDLREKLKRWHADVDCAFRSWSEPWLDPEFRKWDITEALGYIRVPILIVQGDRRSIRHAQAGRGGATGMLLSGRDRGAARHPSRAAARSPRTDAQSRRRLHQPAAARPP